MYGADPRAKHPLPEFPQICFIANTVTHPHIQIGDYTYDDDPEDSENFERNVLYHFDFVGDKLIIGKFCALAQGVTFIMNGANHSMTGFSTYPFFIFGHGWDYPEPPSPGKGDTVVGNDVWIGYGATILPGVQIGHGAIVAAKSVVTRHVEPYTVVGGNPARPLRRRFDEATVPALLAIAWWDWDIAKITRHLPHIVAADLAALQAAV
ncbi:MAG TPA: chloramphenicol acetyltransferase [Cyanobacteria bacterium UBA8156]|jgi:virginiamycin A acetyltransferase|nr:chloramphenicol acetyltransferase [Cyanobacteria bacterium UBA8156]